MESEGEEKKSWIEKHPGFFWPSGLPLLLNVPAAMAQQQYVYPQKGQSAEQQKKDEYDCHTWAVKQTKFDPTVAQAPAQQACTAAGGCTAGIRSPRGGTGCRGRRGDRVSRRRGRQGRRSRSCRRRSGRPGAEPQAGAAAAGIGTAAGLNSAECKTAGVSQGKGRLPRGERLLGEVGRVSDYPCLSHIHEVIKQVA